ncbi:hypothetical protein D3C87_123190 [compost metagenome]
MLRRNLSVLFAMIFCALLVKAQDVPPPEFDMPAENSDFDADPLDVLEPKATVTPDVPALPEFTEIPEPGMEEMSAPPPVVEPPAAQPAVSTPVAETETFSGSNDPDFNRESRFHRIYKTYNENPTSPEAWEKAIAGRPAETYRVQGGDTLWDISNTFFGDPAYWPKIWSLNNGSILNPHEIDPKMQISFFPGSLNDAPTLGLAEAATGEATMSVDTASADAGNVELPERRKKYAPVLKNLPGSLPSVLVGGVNQETRPAEIQLPQSKFPQAVEYMSYFVSETPINSVGKVVETEMGLSSAMEFQYVFVELNDPSPIGKQFMIQRDRGDVKDPAVKKREAHLVEVQGLIEVVARVNDNKPIYRAIVKKTLEHVEVGSVVVVGNLPMMNTQLTQVVSGIGARIIGGQYSNERKMFGANTLVFLDTGSGQGLQEGQTLQVFADQKMRNTKTSSLVNDRPIGLVKVVRVTPNFATAYVLRTEMDIVAGDYVGKPVAQARYESLDAAPVSPAVDSDSELDLDLDMELDDAPMNSAPPEAEPEGGSDDLELEL